MGLRFDPVGGGQFKQAVQSMIEAEKLPVKALEQRKKLEETKMKLFQDFKTKFTGFDKTLAEFANFKTFRELKADLGDGGNFISVTLDKDKAEPGNYAITVDQLAKRTSVISNAFSSPDDPVLGIGYVVMKLNNGDQKEVFIDGDNATLKGVANGINREANSPVHASVIQDASNPEKPWKIILTAKKDGVENGIDFPDFYFLDGKQDFFIDDKNPAENASVQIDGFPIEATSNDIKDFVNGVNVHLKQARPDQPVTLTISEDYQKISGKVKGLVDQLNGIFDFISKQNQVDDKTDTRATFAGDTSLQNIEYRLRNLLHEGFPVGDPNSDNPRFTFMNQWGVEFEKTGQLTFKEDKFTKAIENDFQGISDGISGPYGLAAQMRKVVDGYTRSSDGILSIRENALRNRIKQIDKDIAEKERRIDQKAQAITEQYARLESTLSNLQKQGQYLSASLPSGGSGGLVSQLLGG